MIALSELLLLALLQDEAHGEFPDHPNLGEGKQFKSGSADLSSVDT